jgi:adenine-specific DNA-methyltransferase
MRTRDEVSAEKLRGGFYSPEPLVDLCLERIAVLCKRRQSLRVLEPSAGDGAFIRGLRRNHHVLAKTAFVQAVELLPTEAAKCSDEMTSGNLPGGVARASAIAWAADSDELFDVAVGNPPFVRFQFVSDSEVRAIRNLERRLGISFAGVSNLWLPIFLGALSRLRVGGVFAFIVPAECFTGISSGLVREWLVQNVKDLRFDIFPAGSFPLVLQEIVIVSGRRKATSFDSPSECTFCEHIHNQPPSLTRHSIPQSRHPWTRYLLTKDQLQAFDEASALINSRPLGEVAKFEVAAVTGANDYFSVDSATLRDFELEEWSVPLLPRIRHAPGIRYTASDHRLADEAGAKMHLLDFSAARSDPTKNRRVSRYLQIGVDQDLPLRYKCRIRSPWYRVPFIRRGPLMLSKRSHFYPRMILNEVGVATTDTIYRGSMAGLFAGREYDLAAVFHNSLTLLSAEIEGRSFGGGVLELVPSEICRLRVPVISGFGAELDRLDAVARSSCTGIEDPLIEETDLLLVKADIGLTSSLIEQLAAARHSLLLRRLERNAAAA